MAETPFDMILRKGTTKETKSSETRLTKTPTAADLAAAKAGKQETSVGKPAMKAVAKPVTKPVLKPASKMDAKPAAKRLMTASDIYRPPKKAVPATDDEKSELLRKYFQDMESEQRKNELSAVVPFKKLELHVNNRFGKPVSCLLVLEYEAHKGTAKEYRPVIFEEIRGFYSDTLPAATYRIVLKTGFIFKKERIDYVHLKTDTVKEIEL